MATCVYQGHVQGPVQEAWTCQAITILDGTPRVVQQEGRDKWMLSSDHVWVYADLQGWRHCRHQGQRFATEGVGWDIKGSRRKCSHSMITQYAPQVLPRPDRNCLQRFEECCRSYRLQGQYRSDRQKVVNCLYTAFIDRRKPQD